MKLGEVKAEALMKMGINNVMNISYGDIEGLKENPTYSTYLHAMVGSINRCMDRFYVKRAITVKPTTAVLSESNEATEMSEFGVNDTLARLIPLYIVGDVFAIDEPSIAANNRNEFESALEEYVLRMEHENEHELEVIYGVMI